MNPKGPNPRRRHAAELKAAVLAECEAPGASVAAVALAHGLNANLVRKWLVGRGIKRTGLPAPRAASALALDARLTPAIAAPASFVPVQMPPPAPAKDMKVQLRRGATTVTLCWPAESAGELMAWMRELMK
ncbi:transposase [Ideonella sp.]|uniref:transposase n=1 Tax=Ideonella sp. TaxID=1929293 RepID=UPI002B459681|nr:transposase [Ideonella sp.]HJV69499.1 transposase [Ideonella sp.]